MNNLLSLTTSNSVPHKPPTESAIPHVSSRASLPLLPPPNQALGSTGWGRQGKVSSTTTAPPVELGFASFVARPGLLNASTGFGGQPSMQSFPMAGVSSLGKSGGTGIFAPATPMLPLCPQPQVSQGHKGVLGMFGSSIDGNGGGGGGSSSGSPSESGGRMEIIDDVLSAAAAAAIEQPQNHKFGNLDVDSIDSNVAIFYFGVLSVVTGLRPNFSYVRTAEGNWRAFLTYWGATVSKDDAYEDKFVAKAETCRAALEGLKERYSGWTLPELPGPRVTLGAWIWTALLQGIVSAPFA